MTIEPELLSILRCPETQQRLKAAEPELLEWLNQQIRTGQLRNRAGEPVGEMLDGGLVCEDGRRLYPIRLGIPVMLADESIPLG